MTEAKHIVLAHLFLNLYILAIFQPLYPILEYVIHYEYIVEELCENRDKPVLACNGKCYLGKQLTSDEKDSKEDPRPIPPTVDLDKLLTIREAQSSFSVFNPETTSGQADFQLRVNRHGSSQSSFSPSDFLNLLNGDRLSRSFLNFKYDSKNNK